MQAQHLPAALAAAAAHVPLGGHAVGALPPAAAAAGSAAGLMSLARLPGVSSAHLHGSGASSAGAGGGGAGSVKEEKGESNRGICVVLCNIEQSILSIEAVPGTTNLARTSASLSTFARCRCFVVSQRLFGPTDVSRDRTFVKVS